MKKFFALFLALSLMAATAATFAFAANDGIATVAESDASTSTADFPAEELDEHFDMDKAEEIVNDVVATINDKVAAAMANRTQVARFQKILNTLKKVAKILNIQISK